MGRSQDHLAPMPFQQHPRAGQGGQAMGVDDLGAAEVDDHAASPLVDQSPDLFQKLRRREAIQLTLQLR